MNPTANKRAGAKYEVDLVDVFRQEGIEADRLRLSGKEDEGDILLRPERLAVPGRIIVEAKRERGFNLAQWVKEAEAERDNFGKHRNYLNLEATRFVVIHAARNKGIRKSYVTTTLEDWLFWL